ncbi:MAG: hypothetical protein IPK19_01985 [Chloroflexi bacterium]|nr:hypothetical protein [Chloroflexota bacterium]
MTDASTTPPRSTGTAEPQRESFILVRLWQRISPRLVPLLAVLSAMVLTVPFMILTGGSGDVARGLNIAGTAYAALIEGSIGLVINDRAGRRPRRFRADGKHRNAYAARLAQPGQCGARRRSPGSPGCRPFCRGDRQFHHVRR